MDQELATPAANTPARKQFNVAPMATLYQEYLQRRERMKEDEAFCDQFVEALKAMAPDVDEFVLNGEVVAKLIPGQMNVKKLASELPQVHERFVQRVVETKFDKKAFERAEPGLFAQYRTRRFCVSGE